MIAHKLRHRATFSAPTNTQDPNTGEITVTWTPVFTDEPVEVVPLSGKEFIQSNSGQAGVDTRAKVRWQSGYVPTMRMEFDGQNYNIHAVLPDPSNRRWLTLMCERGVNDGA